MRFRIAVLLVASVAVFAAGCGSSKKKAAAPAKTNTAAAAVKAPGAKVAFIAPKVGAAVGGPVVATVKVSGFKLDPKDVGKKAKQGFGHLHFKMDEGKYDHPKYSGANGQLAVKLGVDGKYSPSVTPSITYRGLPPGKHKLEVYLANNDHSNTGVEASTQFTVKGAKQASAGKKASGKKASAGKNASGGASAPAGKTIAVTMKNIQFAPKALSAKVGETIKWTNGDSVDHNVTATKGETFKSKAFGKGGTFSYKLDKPGKVTYVCTLHPGMTATLTITK